MKNKFSNLIFELIFRRRLNVIKILRSPSPIFLGDIIHYKNRLTIKSIKQLIQHNHTWINETDRKLQKKPTETIIFRNLIQSKQDKVFIKPMLSEQII